MAKLTSSAWISVTFPLLCGFFTCFGSTYAEPTSIRRRMYYDIDTYGFCFQRANATHQVGCSSSPGGNVGTVQLVQNSKNLTWLLTNGPQDPYIAALVDEMFTFDTLQKLNASKKIAGVLLLRPYAVVDKEKPDGESFSPDAKCPNVVQDYYAFINDTEYGQCKARTNSTINPEGQNILRNYWRFPVFVVRLQRHIDFVVNNCYLKYNSPPTESSLPDYPLCQAELRSFMYSATGSRRCVARAELTQNPLNPNRPLCDPITLNSVYTFLNPVVQPTTVQPKSVILILARMDVMPLFTDSFEGVNTPRASGADTTVSGLITLIMIASALAKSAVDFRDKTVVFAALNGESLDYMGSVRVAYDMQTGKFPSRITTNYSSITFNSVDFVIDLGQVGSTASGDKVFVHSEILSRGHSSDVDSKVKKIVKALQEQGGDRLDVVEASAKRGLPPSSLHPLFKAERNLVAVLLADFDDQYANRYFMSEYDTLANVNGSYADTATIFDAPTEFAIRISNIATIVARAVYQLASDNLMVPTSVVADVGLTNQLIYCYAFRCDCSLFRNFSAPSQAMSCGFRTDPEMNEHAEARPVPLYQGPEQYQTSEVTFRTAQSMFYAAGVPINIPSSQCRGAVNASNFLWLENVQNPFGGRTGGVCYKSNSFLSSGISPAFELNDYSGAFPTWTESRWGTDVVLRLFLKPSPVEEIGTLLAGIIVTVLSFLLVYFINRNARTLFALHDDEPVVVTTATTTTTTQIRQPPAASTSGTPVAANFGEVEDLNVVVITANSTAHA